VAKYVYGIVEASAAAPARSGIAGASLDVIAAEGAAALVSDLSGKELRLDREALLVHAQVLEDAMSKGPVLPMNFGVVMEGQEDVRDRLLEPHREELLAQLERLAGKVEVSIRATYEEESLMQEVVREDQDVARLRDSLRGRPEDAIYYGRIKLEELVAQVVERKRELDAREIVDALAPTFLDVEIGNPGHERVALSASFLVERSGLDDFDEALERLASAQAGRLRFKYTGPLPPHSFVALADED
jgi:Gas vesicle synthesis protein GvpL/GvpF